MINRSYIMGVHDTPCVYIDWISMTNKSSQVDIGNLMDSLSEGQWYEVSEKKHGYHHRRRSGDIDIYFGGNRNTVLVEISGAGCKQLFSYLGLTSEGQLQAWAKEKIAEGWTLQRTDWAIDDTEGLLSMKTISDKANAGHYTSCGGIKQAMSFFPKDSNGRNIGETVYIGSKKSDRFLRIYNKALKEKCSGHWVRAETQCRNRYAHRYMLEFCEGGSERIVQLLAGLVTFREEVKSDRNKARWPESPFWGDFLAWASKAKLSLTGSKAPSSIERSAGYLLHLAMTIARVVDHPRYGMSFLEHVVQLGRERLLSRVRRH